MVDLVERLHLLGRQLSMLKRIYESYVLIIDRLLQRQRGLRDEARFQADTSRGPTSRTDSIDPPGTEQNPFFSNTLESRGTSWSALERIGDRSL